MAEKKVRKIEATAPLRASQSFAPVKKRRVAAYARVSTDKDEQQNSYEAQVDYYTTHIQSNPEWIFAGVYSDAGITGTSMKKRDGFNQMVADALAGKIDLILTKSVSRFARNTVDSLTTVRKLKEKGVEVYFEKENIYTLDSKGELLITIMSSLAQEEARNISDNTAWGQRKRFADGKLSLGYSHFLGYKKGAADGEMEIVEEEAVVVRRIYAEFLAGKSTYDIAARLTRDGIPTPAKKTTWHSSTVESILHNEKYKGDAILQKRFTVDFLSKKTKKNEGEYPQYYIENNHPAIIRPEVFEMVQEEFRRRQAAGGHAQCKTPFFGRIVCADCGGFYGRKVWHAGSKYAKVHWHCNNKFQKRQHCSTPTLKEESIEECFVAAFNGLLARKAEIAENYALCLDAITDTSAYQARLDAINRECGELSTLINALLQKGSKQSGSLEEINRQYEGYVIRYDTLQQEKQEVSAQIALCAAKRVQVGAFLAELEKQKTPLTQFDPLVWQATLNYMKVNPDCTVTFVFRDGTEVPRPIEPGVRQYKKRKETGGEVPMANEKTVTPIYQKLPEKGPLRVAAYCRVSSSQDEQLHSLAAQISHYTQVLSGDSSSQFVGIYADRGISGTQAKNRAEFLRLMEDCRAGLVDQIITKSVSRFGRNTVDTLLYTRELRGLGIDVYFEKEHLHSCSAEGELMLTLMAALAESESENMSENIKWGKRRRYEKGCVESLALANLYGYRKDGGALAIVTEEAAVIRRIYSEFLDGLNYEQISQGLNTDGIPTRRGNDVWFNRTVMNVLINEKYMGDCLFQKTFHIDPFSHKKTPNTGQLPQYYLEDCVPAIVSKEVWTLAQMEIQRRQIWKPMSSAELPFKNRIICGSCGSGVVQYYANRKGGILETMWRCGCWRREKAKGAGLRSCAQIKLPLDAPEKAFVRAWNLVVSKKLQYGAALRRRAENAGDALICYRAKEMLRLLDEVGKLSSFDYYFSLKVLDHMELMPGGKLAVVFLSGIRLTV